MVTKQQSYNCCKRTIHVDGREEASGGAGSVSSGGEDLYCCSQRQIGLSGYGEGDTRGADRGCRIMRWDDIGGCWLDD